MQYAWYMLYVYIYIYCICYMYCILHYSLYFVHVAASCTKSAHGVVLYNCVRLLCCRRIMQVDSLLYYTLM